MQTLRWGAVEVDLQVRAVHRGEHHAGLTTKEAGVLAYLAARSEQTISRDELLREVWGHARPRPTRAVDHVVRRVRRKLGDDPRAPRILFCDYGDGYRLRAPQRAEPGTEPRWSRRFIGRGCEQARLLQLLEPSDAMVAVVGPLGVGKSRLVLHALADRPRTFVSLSQIREPALARERVLAGWRRATAAEPSHILVVDGLEGVAAPVAEMVDALRRTSPLRVVFTSQRLPSLRCPRLWVDPLPMEEAVAMFRDQAGGPQDWPEQDVRTLVQGLDGLPLAIELAARRMRLLGPIELWERLQRSLTVLKRPENAPDDHHACFWSCVAAAWGLLDSVQRRLVSALAARGGPVALTDAEALAAALGGPQHHPLDLLQGLVDVSVARRVGEGFRLYRPLAAYARSAKAAGRDRPVGPPRPC